MDTPMKSHSTSTTHFSSQFEDSPVFNYISNLSPIESVKSGHNNHTLNSLNFASPPSVFSSPQISSFSETRFLLRRHNLLDSSRTESSQSENEAKTTEGVSVASQSEQLGNITGEVTDEQATENLELAVEFSSTLKYDCGSPDDNPVPSGAVHRAIMLETVGTRASLAQSVTDVSKEGHCLFEREKDLRRISRIEQNKDPEGCNWVKLISDSNNLLSLDLPNTGIDSEGQGPTMVDSGMMSIVSNVLDDNNSNLGETECVFPTGSREQRGMREPGIELEEIVEVRETDQSPAMLSGTLLNKLVVSDSSDLVVDKSQNYINSSTKRSSQLHCTIQRRSLVFERAESRRRKSICETIQSYNKAATTDDKLVQNKHGSGYSLSKLPGIGLHLNALASTNDGIVVRNENWFSENQLLSTPKIMKPCSSLTPSEVPPDNSSSKHSLERALVPWDGGAQVIETTYQISEYLVGEEFNHNSPRKKRRKSEPLGEDLACKRCNCKRSKCLKLYCECFAAGLYCVEPCSCQDCLNKPIHENTVLETCKQIESRNPLAFAPKVIRSVDAVSEFGEETNGTPASARHKRGCNCRKSSCLKKYCECYQGGVGCSMSCRCVGCKNNFGQKDGEIGTEETDFKEPKQETYEKHAHEVCLEIGEDQELAITPSEIGRPLNLQQPHFSRKPRTSLHSIRSSSQLGNRESPEKLSFESQLQMIPEDGTLETLESSCPQTSGVKSTSPNSKRVSPPYREFGSLTARRSGRKLILRSIPAFPQLSSNHDGTDFP